jgi:prevent-host-death family protein
MKTVTVHEAKTHLSRLLAEVEKGREVTICRGSNPVARLTVVRPEPARRPKVGETTSSRIQYRDGCFAPMADEELKEWGL